MPKGRFILTWDDRIDTKDLSELLQSSSSDGQPIELLVLSACRTAVGDKRAALGLAGVAVRAGARSTLASLWYVSDEATARLMSRFYRELASTASSTEQMAVAKTEITKAEALRAAQASVLQDERFAHPFYWGAFVLVGNWL
ncbi:MAG: CHAT domain-containing protein [Coleofasciculaceae cyanobacterium SM2_3_26]|nr:CHAT domain-containing protein [Coleofasciculaceae cyanobacterium SM2_3_26]